MTRPKDLMDNATPSAQSLAACGLLRLAALTGESRYDEHARQIIDLFDAAAAQHPTAFGRALEALDMAAGGLDEIAVVGDRADLVASVQTRYLPNGGPGLGRALRLPAMAGPPRRLRLRLPELRLPVPRLHRRGTDHPTPSLTVGPDLTRPRVQSPLCRMSGLRWPALGRR